MIGTGQFQQLNTVSWVGRLTRDVDVERADIEARVKIFGVTASLLTGTIIEAVSLIRMEKSVGYLVKTLRDDIYIIPVDQINCIDNRSDY